MALTLVTNTILSIFRGCLRLVMKYRCSICKADYWDGVTKERHSNFYHKGMEYSREIGKEWEMFVEA